MADTDYRWMIATGPNPTAHAISNRMGGNLPVCGRRWTPAVPVAVDYGKRCRSCLAHISAGTSWADPLPVRWPLPHRHPGGMTP